MEELRLLIWYNDPGLSITSLWITIDLSRDTQPPNQNITSLVLSFLSEILNISAVLSCWALNNCTRGYINKKYQNILIKKILSEVGVIFKQWICRMQAAQLYLNFSTRRRWQELSIFQPFNLLGPLVSQSKSTWLESDERGSQSQQDHELQVTIWAETREMFWISIILWILNLATLTAEEYDKVFSQVWSNSKFALPPDANMLSPVRC